MSPRPAAPAHRPRAVAPAIAASLALAVVLLSLPSDPGRTWALLLIAAFYLLSVGLGGALFIAVHALAQAGWTSALRRVPEALLALLPAGAALLVLVLALGGPTLYSWGHGAEGHPDLPAAKALYLSPPLVLARAVVFLAAWLALARGLRRTSLAQDSDPDLAHHRRLVRRSAGFVVVFAPTLALASVDWLMALEPHWASTMFPVYTFAGLFLRGLAAVALGVVVLGQRGELAGVVRDHHRHDLGKLLFAFSTFWAYIWLSQYLLVWYGNIPEEAAYYALRTRGDWGPLYLVNLVLNWALPFVLLLPRRAKRDLRMLAGVAALVLLAGWLDLYLMVLPTVTAEPALGAPEAAVVLGTGALALLLTAAALRRAPLVPRNDPFLAESLRQPHG